MKSLKAKLALDKAGQLSPGPEIVADCLKAYEEASEIAFGNEADRAMLVRPYSNISEDGKPTSAGRYTGAERRIFSGAMPEWAISGYATERFNLTLRLRTKRLTWKTNAFSKTPRRHEPALALTKNLHPENTAICRMCLWFYRTSGYRAAWFMQTPEKGGY